MYVQMSDLTHRSIACKVYLNMQNIENALSKFIAVYQNKFITIKWMFSDEIVTHPKQK